MLVGRKIYSAFPMALSFVRRETVLFWSNERRGYYSLPRAEIAQRCIADHYWATDRFCGGCACAHGFLYWQRLRRRPSRFGCEESDRLDLWSLLAHVLATVRRKVDCCL